MIPAAYCQRTLSYGRILAVVPLMFSRARLTLGDEQAYEEAW